MEIIPQIKIHKMLGVEDGLIQSTVRVIYKDSNGFMWFGTNLGVSRWDGINFKNYSATTGLPGHIVYSIKEDQKGNLYFGTSDGLAVYRDGKITRLISSEKDIQLRIKAIEISDEGEVYLGTNKGLYRVKDQLITNDSIHNPKPDIDILSGTKSKDGKIYFSTAGGEIIVVEKGNVRNLISSKKFKNKPIESVFCTKENKLIFSSGNKIIFYSNNRIITINPKQLANFKNILCLGEDDDGVLYLGTDDGIILWKNEVIDLIVHQNGLSSEKIYSIYKDDDGTMYFGMNSGGVAIVNRYRTIAFNEELGLINNNVTSICKGNSGEFYFGTREQGSSVYKDGKFSKLNICCDQIICIHKAKDGTIYFGTNGGVVILRKGKTQILSRKDGLISNIITAITSNIDGSIYIGTVRGLSIYKDGKITNLTTKEGLGDNLITSLSTDNSGNVYVVGSFFNGVTILNKDEIEILNKDKGLVTNTVFSVLNGSDGNLYVGTSEGLNIISKGKIKLINTASGLSDNSINGLVEDNSGRIYLSTNRGVNILDFSKGSLNIEILRSDDGIAGDECNMGATYKDDEGNLWFGTIKGVVSFNPERIKPSTIPPQIRISEMYLFDKEIKNYTSEKPLEFSYNENYFKFTFFGSLLSSPKRVIYSLRLKGIEDKWRTTDQNSVQYTNLDPGKYTFQVKARNEWGYSSQIASVSFLILPPVWMRWWFITIVILLVGGTTAFLITYRVKSLLSIERLRLKIAADLHDNIGASLTEISIMSEVVKNKLKGEEKETKKYLDLISNESRNVISNMRDIIWMINPKQDSLRDLILRLNDSFAEIFNQKEISFKTENIELLKNITLPMEYRQNLYLILKEGINNCLKYSCCSELILSARMNNNNLEVLLKDNGVGIRTNGSTNGNGLSNIKERAKKIGGNLIIESGNQNGTSIKFVGRVV